MKLDALTAPNCLQKSKGAMIQLKLSAPGAGI